MPLWIAKEARIFDTYGLDVDVQLIASTTGMAALLSGQTQIAQIGGSEALSAAAEGGDVTVIGMLTPVYPYRFYTAPAINTVSDLRGKKVGVAGVGGSAEIATRVALRRLGIEPDRDVAMVPTGSVQNLTAAMLAGRVQAAVSHPPESLELEAKGFQPQLDLAQLKLPSSSHSISTRRSYAAAQRGVVQKYIDAIVGAIVREKKDKAFAITIMKKYIRTSDETTLSATYDFYSQGVVPALPYPRLEQYADVKAVLGRNSEKVRAFDVARLLDDSFVKSAAERRKDRI